MKAACPQVLLPPLWALCLLTLAGGQPKAPRKCSMECRGFTRQLAEKLIRSYRLTEPSCRKQATIFITVKSKEICADSKEDWVQKIKDKLDGKKATVMPPHDVTSAEEPGSLERHVGLPEVTPSQSTAPTGFFQGTGTTVRERIHAPAARTEVSSKSPLGRQNPTQLPAGPTPVIQEEAAHSEVSPEAKRESSDSPVSSTGVAAGVGSSQPTPYSTVQGMGSPNSNSDLMANGSLDPTNPRANTPDTASSSSRSDLPSIWDSMKTTTLTDTAPETTSISTLSSSTAMDKAASVHTNRVVGPSADVFATTFDYSSPVGKQEPSDTVVSTHQAFSGQARVQMITVRPKNLPLPSFLPKSQMHFFIPVSVVCGLMVSSVVLVWVYLKFGVKPEETSREMVQGLLYQQAGHQDNVYPMEVI
ncbi:fractalkine-like [Prinia subflava]|uniref:fractalkine-like n=1 Tax=Prinia subflava TaxID=208062 RepID=UPI002FE2DE2F